MPVRIWSRSLVCPYGPTETTIVFETIDRSSILLKGTQKKLHNNGEWGIGGPPVLGTGTITSQASSILASPTVTVVQK